MARVFVPRMLAVLWLGLLAVSNTATASSCSSSFYNQYDSCLISSPSCSPYSSPAEFVAAHPHCFPGGSSTSQVTVSGSSFQQIGSISSALFSRLVASAGPMQVAGAPVKGIAAGGTNAWNGWANVSSNDTRQTFTVGPNVVRNSVDITNAVFGADYAVAPGLVVGVSGAIDSGQGSTQPTAIAAREASSIDGYAIAPYLGYQLTKEMALDVSIGFGSGTTAGSGNTEMQADRLFYAANLGYSRWIKDLQLTGKFGYLHGEEDFSNTRVAGVTRVNTAAKNKLDRWQVGLQAGYWLGNGVQPYAGLSYLSDRRSASQAGIDPIGKGAWQWALGLNFFSLASGVTGGIAYTQEDGRSNQKNNVLTGNVGLRF